MSTDNEAFISQCSSTLRVLIEYIHDTKIAPISLAPFQSLPRRVLDACFTPATEERRMACLVDPHPLTFHEDIAYDFEISQHLAVIECYFALHKSIHDTADKWIDECNLTTEKTAAFYYAIKEGHKCSNAINAFHEHMRLSVDDGYRILVCSDCPKFLSKTSRRFGHDVCAVRAYSKNIPLLPLVSTFSRCAKVFFTTGGASLWMLMYRGSKEGVYQFHPHLRVFYDLSRRVFLRSPTDSVTAVVAPTMTDRWMAYRLGDMFFSSYAQSQEDGKQLHLQMFSDSIASEYMRRTSKAEQYTVLARIVCEKQARFECMPDWVIHIRGGDVLEDEFELTRLISTCEEKDVGAIYIRPVHKILTDFQPSPTDTNLHVCVMTGGCHVHEAPKSLDLVSLIADKLRSHAKIARVTIRFFENPDDDFVLMCSVRNFIPSGGGFSEAVSTLRNNFSTVVKRRKQRRPT